MYVSRANRKRQPVGHTAETREATNNGNRQLVLAGPVSHGSHGHINAMQATSMGNGPAIPMESGPSRGAGHLVPVATAGNPANPGKYSQQLVPAGGVRAPNQSLSAEENAATMSLHGLSPEMPDAKAGIVRIHGKLFRGILQFITARIHEGPLYDIRVENRACVRVTFQHAAHAISFLKSTEDRNQETQYGRLGQGYEVELAQIIDWDDNLRRMNQPIRERRRLSFARKRLFSDGLTSDKWRQDMREAAGNAYVDFLWVFNSGNGEFSLSLHVAHCLITSAATAVFTSTRVARSVWTMYNHLQTADSVYSDVSVTYSSDPCEKELVLAHSRTSRTSGKWSVKRFDSA